MGVTTYVAAKYLSTVTYLRQILFIQQFHGIQILDSTISVLHVCEVWPVYEGTKICKYFCRNQLPNSF